MGVGILFYSESKIALELDLIKGTYEIPKIEGNSIKEIKNLINQRWNIECEDIVKLKNDCFIVNNWENRLKSKHGRKMIWFNFNNAITKISENDKRSLTFFINTYREVHLPNFKQVGIATKEECIKHNLITKGLIILKNDEILTYEDQGLIKTHLFELKLGETASEIIKSDNFIELSQKLINKPKRISLTIAQINDESLTFLAENVKNTEFKPINDLKCDIIEQIKEILP